jgi:phenylacetic acid degradation operon negative regulatory protein
MMSAASTPLAHAPRPDPHVRRWIARQIGRDPPRASSLIVTVWGDAIAPHGGAAVLPGLIRLLAPFGINERLVRTSVFRLARQGWLAATPVGRRSLYALTADGARRFAAAHQRIYTCPDRRWNGTWELVLADGLAPGERRALAAELQWAGFGDFGPGVRARPAPGGSTLPGILRALGCADRVIAARATDDGAAGGRTLASRVPQAWDLAGVGARYREILNRFGTLIERFRIPAEDERHPEQCFVARTLLIHAYRRALLRDPQLPAALLPLDWPGAAAFALCRDFYRLTWQASERHLLTTLEGERGVLPPADAAFGQRFGGLSGAHAGGEAGM